MQDRPDARNVLCKTAVLDIHRSGVFFLKQLSFPNSALSLVLFWLILMVALGYNLEKNSQTLPSEAHIL
jgi:hypothetical protein